MDITIRGSKGTKTLVFDRVLIKALSDKHPHELTIVLNGLDIGQAKYVINACSDYSILFEYYGESVEDIKSFERVYYNRIADYIRSIHINDTLRIMQSINKLPDVLAYIDTVEFTEMLAKYDITLTCTNLPYYDSNISNTRNWDYRLIGKLGLTEHEVIATSEKWHDNYFTTTLDKLVAYTQLQFYIQNGIEPFKEEDTDPIPDWILY